MAETTQKQREWLRGAAQAKSATAYGDVAPITLAVLRDLEAVEGVIEAAHGVLSNAGVADAQGQVCNDPECQSHLVHRVKHGLKAQRDRLAALLREARENMEYARPPYNADLLARIDAELEGGGA